MIIQQLPLSALTTFPGNPRRGNLDLIKASLKRREQYKPIIVSSDRVILAGNHTYMAAVELGWERLFVVQLDLDSHDPRAAEIVLVDNRSADIGGYDEAELTVMLGNVTDLDLAALGYDTDDLAGLRALQAPHGHEHGETDEDILDETDEASWPILMIQLSPDYAKRWAGVPGEDDTERAVYLLDEVAL